VTTGSPCAEIAADAVGLEALPADAPERVRAEAHALTCAACARSLAEGRHLLALLDSTSLPAPSPAALERASAAVLAELDAERVGAQAAKAGAGRLASAVAAAVVAAWAVPLALARAPIGIGSPFALSLGLAALAAVASAATVRWGGRVAAAFPALAAVTALLSSSGRGLDAAGGLHCTFIEVLTAVGVGGGAWLATRGFARRAPRPEVVVAAVGGGALAGHAALHLACAASSELPHVLVFHTAPVALAVGLALLLTSSARRTPAVRGSSRP
jgi:hypothetical protein